jgi:hypothetical protein
MTKSIERLAFQSDGSLQWGEPGKTGFEAVVARRINL